MKDLLTNDDVSQLTGLTYSYLYTLRRRKLLPKPDTYIGRTPLWKRQTIENWMNTRPNNSIVFAENEFVQRKKRDGTKKNIRVNSTWSKSFVIKKLGNRNLKVYSISAFAKALNRSMATIRLWERRSLIPKAPYRLDYGKNLIEKTNTANRFYSKAMIDACIQEFDTRGLLNQMRIDWNKNADLYSILHEQWSEIVVSETKK